MCFIIRHSLLIHKIVLKSGIIDFIVLSRICDVVVVPERLGVQTPLCIHIHDSIRMLCLLGGHHDDTIRTTGTVESIGSSILKDGH